MSSDVSGRSSIKAIFVAARKLSDAERRAYLQQTCGEDLEMRANVEGLLAALEQTGQAASSPLDKAVVKMGSAATGFPDDSSEEEIDISSHPVIGPYKLLERLGEGGMGTVYMAEQKQPVRRRVALKLIKPGMDSQQVIARFEAERQALAMMNHSNIARIYDGGLTEQGLPYFVMELVRGSPIDTYCDDATLSVPDRLKLFMDVCRAIQHAHQKGIIHRDLKPSNILITLHDSVPMVKVIDFGIAKALDHDLTQRTLFTRFTELIGTPAYMSPEQAEMSGLDVDTRSDVYSLGVMLYRLLAGVTPFDESTLRSAGLDEMRRIIREDEPSRPSRKVSTLDNKLASTISERRRTDSRALSLSMRRELDWIVMKALDKDRNRRYESASGLARDIQRYLADEPVQACPPSVSYRLRKLARRKRATLASGTLILIALILGTVVSIWQARQADQARRVAEDKSSQLEDKSSQLEQQRDLARKNEAFAQQLVYAADVRLAAQAWEGGDVRHYADLLDRHAQTTSGEDLRGFEWRYLRQLGTANVRTIAERAEGICSVRHSPDGKLLATGLYDGTIHVRDGRSGRQLATLSGHVELVRGIDFSPDGKRLVSIGYGGVIRIWDLETFSEIYNIKAFEDVHGYRVCFALDGTAVIAIAEMSPAKLWDVDSGELMETFGANGRGCWGLAVSPDGQSCIVRDNLTDFRIWDLSPRKHVAWLRFPSRAETAKCLRFSPDGNFIAAGTDDNLVRLYEARTGKMIASFAGHDDQIWDVAFHPSGSMLASCDLGGVIRTWHLGNKEETSDTNEVEDWPRSFRGHAARVWSIDFSPDGKRLVSASKDGTVRTWTGRVPPRQTLDVTESIASEFLPSGNELIIATRHMLAIWNRQTNEVRPFGESFQEDAKSLSVSTDGETIATGHDDGTIRLWNRKTKQIDGLLRGHEDSVHGIAFSPDAALLASASRDGTGILWDVASRRQRHVIDVPPHATSAAFSPDGHSFAISSENDVMIYDADSGDRRNVLRGHQHTACCLAFSPDGRSLVTGSADRTIRIWDVRTGSTRHVIAAHQTPIYSLAFSPDGRTIATGDERGMVAFSHVETGRFLFELRATHEEICSLSFSPNGKTLAATCFDSQVVLLHAPGLPTFDQESDVPNSPAETESDDDNGMLPAEDVSSAEFSHYQRLTAADENFGNSVSISGDTAIVGASKMDDTDVADDGAAYAFVRRAGKWIEQQKLIVSDASIDYRFGASVALDGDTAIVGAYQDSSRRNRHHGSAYIFTRSDGVWSEQQKLTASDAASFDRFGLSVALCGNTAIVGSHCDDDHGSNSGSAYLFTRESGVWRERKKLTASDAAKYDNFGYSVSIRGDTAAVGARTDDHKIGGNDSGSVYVFTRSGSIWSEQKKLTASDAEPHDRFGCSVSVSGDTVVVGAHLHDSVALDSGKVYIFMRRDGEWNEQQLVPSNAAAHHRFGHSVSICGDMAIVGAWSDQGGGVDSGSAHIFSRHGGRWIEQPELTDSVIAFDDQFGFSVSVNGKTAIVGAPSKGDSGHRFRGAYVFE